MGKADLEFLEGKPNFCSSYQNCCGERKQQSNRQDIQQLVGKNFIVVLVSRTAPMFYPRYFPNEIVMLQDSKGRNWTGLSHAVAEYCSNEDIKSKRTGCVFRGRNYSYSAHSRKAQNPSVQDFWTKDPKWIS